MLGSRIEYQQAAKRLEEVAQAPPGTPEAREREELMALFREYDKKIKKLSANHHPNKPK